jgi:predicted dienelactone hydrolase
MWTLTRRRLLGAASAAAAAGLVPAPAAAAGPAPLRPTLPAPTGPYPVGAVDLHLVDHDRPDPWLPDRRRELMVTVRYPSRPTGREPRMPYLPPLTARRQDEDAARTLGIPTGRVDWAGMVTHARTGAPPRGRHPVVLYSPGGGRLRAEGTVLVEDLASHGHVVVTVDHTYEAPAVQFPGGRLEVQRLPDLDPTELLRRLLYTRVADTRFVLDRLPLARRFGADPARVGMFGHSAGGFTTAETMLVDRRIDAGVDLDGSMAFSFGAGDFGEVVHRGLDRPFLLMGAGDASGVPHTHVHSVDWGQFWDRSTGWKRDLYVAAGEHFTFTDVQVLLPQLARAFALPDAAVTGSVGTVDPGRIVAALRAYVTAFFDLHLRGRPQPLFDGPSPRYPDVTFV